jgi:hypothetical protein
MYGFEREKNNKRVLVIMNLGTTTQNFTCKDTPSANDGTMFLPGIKNPRTKALALNHGAMQFMNFVSKNCPNCAKLAKCLNPLPIFWSPLI